MEYYKLYLIKKREFLYVLHRIDISLSSFQYFQLPASLTICRIDILHLVYNFMCTCTILTDCDTSLMYITIKMQHLEKRISYSTRY